jgi:uncharacterized membrane protein
MIMPEKSDVKQLVNVGIIAAFATLSFIGTLVIRIPIPATGGYFNLGDTFVMIAALLYGPIIGAVVGFIGPALADAVGYPQFILATAIVKGLEGALVGWIGGRSTGTSMAKPVIALAVGIAVLVIGYFVFEAFIYPLLGTAIPFFKVTTFEAAIGELLPNFMQGIISALIAFGIWRVFRGRAK